MVANARQSINADVRKISEVIIVKLDVPNCIQLPVHWPVNMVHALEILVYAIRAGMANCAIIVS